MIFRFIISALLILVSLTVQSHPSFSAISIFGIKPDLLFIIIIYLAYRNGALYGEICGFSGGFMLDAVSNAPFGMFTFPAVVCGYLVGKYGSDLFKNTVPTVMLLVFTASVLKGTVTFILCLIFSEGYFMQIFTVVFPEAFYNGLVSPLFFLVLDYIFDRHQGSEEF